MSVDAILLWGGPCAGKMEEKKEMLAKKIKTAKEFECRKEKEKEVEGEGQEVVEGETETEVEASSAIREDVPEEEKEW